METLALELPEELVRAANLDVRDLSRETAKLVALDLFREQKVSLGRAAELCGTPLYLFMDFAAAHGVPPVNYGVEELEEERRTMEKLGF